MPKYWPKEEKKVIALISVYSEDSNVYTRNVRHLYNILLERTPEESISHKTMPLYSAHEKFMASKPYKEWFMIHEGSHIKGAIYISKQDEIGLFIYKEHRGNNVGSKALRTLLDEYPNIVFRANINPSNYKSINFFKKFGFLWSINDDTEVTYIRPII